MFLSPLFLMKAVPFPQVVNDAGWINGRLFLFSEAPDLDTSSHMENLKIKAVIQEFADNRISEPTRLKPFDSIYSGGGKIYLFSPGEFRIYNGTSWEEVKKRNIGADAKGAISEERVWTLSRIQSKPALFLFRDGEEEEIPLPETTKGNELSPCSASLISYKGGLYLFWRADDVLYQAAYIEGKWTEPSLVKTAVKDYRARDLAGRIYLFTRDQSSNLYLAYFDGEQWSDEKQLQIGTAFALDYIPAIIHNAPALIVQNVFSANYYELSEPLKGPVRLTAPFKFRVPPQIILLSLVPNIITAFFIYLISALIGKYKLRRWEENTGEYEFASLFRRFLALTLDGIMLMIPFVLAGLILFRSNSDLLNNPLSLIGVIMLLFVGYFISLFLYHSILEGTLGYSLGKKICGIRVLKDDFTKCTLGRGFLRNFLRIVDVNFYYLVGVVIMCATLKWQRLGDIAAGTIVVRNK